MESSIIAKSNFRSEMPVASYHEGARHGGDSPSSITSPQHVDKEDVQAAPLWTDTEEAAIRRKFDRRLIPMFTALYLLCFLDRANIGNARIQGLLGDLKLHGSQFNWALTVFFPPCLLIEIPSNIVVKNVGPKIVIPAIVFAFGVVTIGTAFVTSFTGLMICRAFLGLSEGGIQPGIAFALSCFYRRSELMLRVGLFIASASLAGAFGGLLAAALVKIPAWGAAGARIHTWRNIFFFEGIVTVIIAIIGYFILPASPDKAMFLTERERWIALARIEAEHKEAASEKTQLKHVRLALFNVNTIVCAAGFFLTNVSVTSISYFLPTILANLGWTATKAQLYSVPPYVVACCWQVALSYISDRYKRRGLSVFFCAVLVIIGYSLLRDLAPAKYRYLGTFFAAAGAFPLGPALLSWVLNNNAGPNIRSIASAAIVAVGLNGAITATWTYRESDGPRYIHGHTINLITSTMLAALSLFGIAYIRWENQQRAAGKRDYRLQKFQGESGGAEQLLGSRHPAFRYME